VRLCCTKGGLDRERAQVEGTASEREIFKFGETQKATEVVIFFLRSRKCCMSNVSRISQECSECSNIYSDFESQHLELNEL
jgi:hypothetical protein